MDGGRPSIKKKKKKGPSMSSGKKKPFKLSKILYKAIRRKSLNETEEILKWFSLLVIKPFFMVLIKVPPYRYFSSLISSYHLFTSL